MNEVNYILKKKNIIRKEIDYTNVVSIIYSL